ncbi:hypothetical protein GGR92_003817 [Spirosoma lacussanchae]|uniref:hypothetical protein n=1 Tax=Spirosoma lacussanchae TaxID=1884249 RepID=UPI001107EEF9|nr:hypothetical protein [Spirosoma lacussanchae]
MNHQKASFYFGYFLLSGSLAGCNSGIRYFDFISKQFTVTYNVDSTRGLDSSRMASLTNITSVYIFSEGGKGTNHVQMGMLSRDTPFTWSIRTDSLIIDNKGYAVQKQDIGYILRADSVKIILSKQP